MVILKWIEVVIWRFCNKLTYSCVLDVVKIKTKLGQYIFWHQCHQINAKLTTLSGWSRGCPNARPLLTKFFSISCSFWEDLIKLYCWVRHLSLCLNILQGITLLWVYAVRKHYGSATFVTRKRVQWTMEVQWSIAFSWREAGQIYTVYFYL